MKNSIAIAGLGWLGLPLAQRLETLGYKVKGSVTRLEKATSLQKKGFDAYPLMLTEAGVEGAVDGLLSEIETLVIMIPPGLRRHSGADFVLKMTHFLEAIQRHRVGQVILISSTSVYADHQGQVTEKDLPQPETEAGKQLFQVEQLFFNSPAKTTIVRFGGLFGGNRQPVRYLAGREGLQGGDNPINLIHRNDCLNILTSIITKGAYGHIFNAVMPSHPSKRAYYTAKAQELGLDPPQFAPSDGTSGLKQVDSVHLQQILNYTFQHTL